MKIFVLTILLAFLYGCASHPQECELAPSKEGWEAISSFPEGIEYKDEAKGSRYTVWFKNEKGMYMACNRSIHGKGCGESATVFYKSHNGWKSTLPEVIVCGSSA